MWAVVCPHTAIGPFVGGWLVDAGSWRWVFLLNLPLAVFVVALAAKTYRTVLRTAAKQSVAGGQMYDALIGECARQAKAETLLTFNRRHFEPPPSGVTIVDQSIDDRRP